MTRKSVGKTPQNKKKTIKAGNKKTPSRSRTKKVAKDSGKENDSIEARAQKRAARRRRKMSRPLDTLAGKFIVIDGPDGAGKTTQAKLLAGFLIESGLEVQRIRDPGGTEIGDEIRTILLDNRHHKMSVQCELMLYMASRAQLAQEVIAPALAEGTCVLGDRYVSSTIAYQGAGGADVAAIAAYVESLRD